MHVRCWQPSHTQCSRLTVFSCAGSSQSVSLPTSSVHECSCLPPSCNLCVFACACVYVYMCTCVVCLRAYVCVCVCRVCNCSAVDSASTPAQHMYSCAAHVQLLSSLVGPSLRTRTRSGTGTRSRHSSQAVHVDPVLITRFNMLRQLAGTVAAANATVPTIPAV